MIVFSDLIIRGRLSLFQFNLEIYTKYFTLPVEDYTNTYKTPEEFEKGVFDFADGALNGSLRFSSSSTMSKRLTWLSQNNKLRYRYPEKAKSNNPEDAWYKEWFVVERNEETFKVLVGEKRVKPK